MPATIYPPALVGARLRGVVWCGLLGVDEAGKATGERFGVPKIFADLNGHAHLIYEGEMLNVKDPALEANYRAACAHYGIAVSDKPMNLGGRGGCR